MNPRALLASARTALLDALGQQPPHQLAARAARVLLKTKMAQGANPLALASVVLRQGMGVRSIHAIGAAMYPERIALIDRREQLTYREVNRRIDAFGNALVADGAQPFDRGQEPVGLFMENRCEYVVAWMGLARVGIACAHLGTSSTAVELAPLLQRTGIRRLVVSAATRERAQQAARNHPELGLRLIDVDADHETATPAATESADFAAWMQRYDGAPPVRRPPRGTKTSAASVVYTSGTTGRPKGAVRDLQSVGVIELLAILDGLPLRAGDRHLVVAPLYHSGAQVFTLIASALASTIVLLERFDAMKVATVMAREQIESTFMVPTMLARVLDLPDAVRREHPTPHLRAIISGAAPFSVGLRARAIERYGADAIFDFYGATELGWVTLANGRDMQARPGTLGRALAGQQVRVIDSAGRAVPPGTIGKIYTRSAQHMHGYLNDAAATSEVSQHSWATVDDLGYLDEAGHLFLTGRARDMVISGGVNVYPVEIENVLSQHPSIADVAVIGLPDPEWGERVTAVIVPSESFRITAQQSDDHATALEQIDEWLKARLAKAKRPRRWEIVDVLPRNPTGKVLKRDLVARFVAATEGTDSTAS